MKCNFDIFGWTGAFDTEKFRGSTCSRRGSLSRWRSAWTYKQVHGPESIQWLKRATSQKRGGVHKKQSLTVILNFIVSNRGRLMLAFSLCFSLLKLFFLLLPCSQGTPYNAFLRFTYLSIFLLLLVSPVMVLFWAADQVYLHQAWTLAFCA
jgi:hypothetical protein